MALIYSWIPRLLQLFLTDLSVAGSSIRKAIDGPERSPTLHTGSVSTDLQCDNSGRFSDVMQRQNSGFVCSAGGGVEGNPVSPGAGEIHQFERTQSSSRSWATVAG